MPASRTHSTAEHERMTAQGGDEPEWRRWGPYLSERQWGTVREDYSADGDAWNDFSHDQARSRAYRWGEDGIAGICDKYQHLCLALALWNGQDPFLKERLFGLTNGAANHGEDVKELYYYLDATPTHSYLKMLYKYPQRPFPYARLQQENRSRGREMAEFELLDCGVFDDDRYFDVFVEYAKAAPHDILMQVTACNRGTEDAPLHLLPQLWFRNEWSWGDAEPRPQLSVAEHGGIEARHARLGTYHCHLDGAPELLFCDNATNTRRLYGMPDRGYFKDAFHDHVVAGMPDAVNPARTGTKAAGHFVFEVPAKGRVAVRLRLASTAVARPFDDFGAILALRQAEADAYYDALQAGIDDADARRVQRQALAGLIWSKQFYFFDVPRWLEGDAGMPAPPQARRQGRNRDWEHLNNADVISMPDKWEYPWYAAWDLAFHCIPFAMVDPTFAKEQLVLMTREWYMHPNGQIPACEWEFGDVNPPVHAWAAWEVYAAERDANGGKGDTAFLERILHKLLLNFTWWVNRKDPAGHNVFQGGFLGLDNIGVLDRSSPLPNGGYLDQADGTSWMAMYCLNLMRIALELAQTNHVYEDIATKFFEHFLYIAKAMNNIGDQGIGLWDEEDQFFYDVLRFPDGRMMPLRVRSMVGLIPLFAVEIIEPELLERLPGFKRRLEWFMKYRPELAALVSHWMEPGRGNRRLLSLLRPDRMRHVLRRMLDENEFLSPYGVRSLSRAHLDKPYVFDLGGQPVGVNYQPAESETGLFGGNSNWRGPVWFPVNYMLVNALSRFAEFYGAGLKVECPTGSGRECGLDEVAENLTRRLVSLFLRDEAGGRPFNGASGKLNGDPHFRDHILFHEYFHGESGRGMGASHQTGWTGLVAKLLQPRR